MQKTKEMDKQGATMNNIHQEALHVFGAEARLRKLACELTEAALAIHHHLEGKASAVNIVQELYDVLFVSQVMKYMPDCTYSKNGTSQFQHETISEIKLRDAIDAHKSAQEPDISSRVMENIEAGRFPGEGLMGDDDGDA
ncbi:MAG: hypothetical protein HGA87_03305 [Desulfobulbaceae bacterium]|nr:hypothetical protein [Desulfobulbaceae bacterium]